MKKVVLVFNVDQTNPIVDVNTFELIKFEEVSDGNIGLKKLYELINCDLVERVNLGVTDSGKSIDLIIDEEGTFGQWTRGVAFELRDRRYYEIFGNSICVISTEDGEWVGWDDEYIALEEVGELIIQANLFDVKDSSIQVSVTH